MPIIDKPRDSEGLIQRCPQCTYCTFESILLEEQRKAKVLKKRDDELPVRHIHRQRIEELCGRDYDGICDMKYAAMRAEIDDFTATQMKALEIFKLDLGKIYGHDVAFNFAGREWTRKHDFGRGVDESYAQRFREIWGLGIRTGEEGNERQSISAENIYGYVLAEGTHYDIHFLSLKLAKADHEKRAAVGKTRKAG